MPTTHETLNQSGAFVADCPCGRWQFRKLPAFPPIGFTPVVVHCPRCKHDYLIVVRIWVAKTLQVRVLGIVRFHGWNAGSLRTALQDPNFSAMNEEDVEFIVTVAQLLAEKVPA